MWVSISITQLLPLDFKNISAVRNTSHNNEVPQKGKLKGSLYMVQYFSYMIKELTEQFIGQDCLDSKHEDGRGLIKLA